MATSYTVKRRRRFVVPTRLQPVFRGGGQEFGRRGGTPSPELAWALAEAAERQMNDNERIRALRYAL